MEDNFDSKSREELIAEIRRLRNKPAEESDALGTAKQRYASVVLDHMYQFVSLIGVDGRVLISNLPALKGAGINLSDVVGKLFWETHWWDITPEIPKQLRQAFYQALETKQFVRYEVDVWGRNHGEEIITVDFSLNPVLNDKNEVLYLLAEGRDITEKKSAEAQVAQKNQELTVLYERIKELDKLKSQFIANISHELRTPLALILGPVEKMLDMQQVQQDATLQKNLETVVTNSYTLLKHVNDLLDISKLEAGRVELCYSELNFPDLIYRICAHFELQAANRLMTFEVNAEGSWTAQVDADKVERILLNVLSNAFKFTPESGLVRVTVKREEKSELQSRGQIEIVVEDSGPGIKEELWGVIFDRFQQGEGGATRNYGGTGLGLAIVKELVTLHNGHVEVGHSQALGGAQMKIHLPSAAPEGAHVISAIARNLSTKPDMRTRIADFARQTLSDLSSHIAPAKPNYIPSSEQPTTDAKSLVLVVEDNPSMNQFIVSILEEHFRVISAFDGEQGLARVIEHLPDCVVTDVMMPHMSGDEMVAEIRTRRELDTIPVIMLTAKADDELKVSMLMTGAQDYLSKPFQPMDLVARVNNLVSMRRTWLAMQQALSTQQRDLRELIDDISIMFGHDEYMKNLLQPKSSSVQKQ
jgi:PAS domain S-box-containing protein